MGPCLQWDFCLCFYMFASHPPCVYVAPNPGNISNPAVGPNKLANQPTLKNTHAPLLKQWIKTDVEVWKVSTAHWALLSEQANFNGMSDQRRTHSLSQTCRFHFLKRGTFTFSTGLLSLTPMWWLIRKCHFHFNLSRMTCSLSPKIYFSHSQKNITGWKGD